MNINKSDLELVKAEATRVVNLINALKCKEDGTYSYYEGNNYQISSELKIKMHELRRDTIRLDKQIRGKML